MGVVRKVECYFLRKGNSITAGNIHMSLLAAASPTPALEKEHKAAKHGQPYAAVGLLIGRDCVRLKIGQRCSDEKDTIVVL